MRNVILFIVLIFQTTAFAQYPKKVDFKKDRWVCKPAPLTQPFVFLGMAQKKYSKLEFFPVSRDGWFAFRFFSKGDKSKVREVYYGNLKWASGFYPKVSSCKNTILMQPSCLKIHLRAGKEKVGTLKMRYFQYLDSYITQIWMGTVSNYKSGEAEKSQKNSAWFCKFRPLNTIERN